MPTPRRLARLLTAAALVATAIAAVLASPLPQARQATATSFATNCTQAAPVLNGSVYEVSTPGQLLSLALTTSSTSLSARYRQTTDLDLTNCGNWPGIGEGRVSSFDPWGTPFTGIYDGNGKTIRNVSLSSTSGYGWGLFRNVSGSAITNLNLTGVTVSANGTSVGDVGALIGFLLNATVSGVTITDAIVDSPNSDVGGVAGSVDANAFDVTLLDVSFSGSVTDGNNIGGLIGSAYIRPGERLRLSSVTTSAQLTGDGASGGLMGLADVHGILAIDGATFDGAITSLTYRSGGLVGQAQMEENEPGARISVDRAGVTGDIEALDPNNFQFSAAGGLFGNISFDNSAHRATITNASTQVDVSSPTGQAGGVSGRVSGGGGLTISNSVIGVDVTADSDAGGVIGYLNTATTISAVIVQGSVSGTSDLGGVVGRTGTSSSRPVVIDQTTVSAPVVGTSQAGGVIGFASTHVTISAVTRSGDVSISASSYGAGGFVGYNDALSLLINNATSSSTVRGGSEVGGAVGVMDVTTLRDVALSGNVSGSYDVGCYVGTAADATDPELTLVGGSATGTKKVGSARTLPCTEIPGPGDPTSCDVVLPVSDNGTYLVASPGNLVWITISTAGGRLGARYRQTANIDLTPCGGWPGIGGGSINPFTGTYDGDGYTISNLTSTSAVATRWGLFRNTSNATITDLTLNGVTISGTAIEVGALIGYAAGTTISAVNVTNASVSASSDVGGVVGKIGGSARSVIQNVTVTGAVNGTDSVGGVLGWAYGPTALSDVAATVAVTGRGSIGGVVGYVYDAVEIDRVTSRGDVTGSGSEVGGIIGFAEVTVTVNDVTRTGAVQGVTDVGGLIGEADGLGLTVTGGSINSTISATGSSGNARIGGVLGDADSNSMVTITDLTVNGNVSTTADYAGGVVGSAAGHVTLSAITRSGTVTGGTYVGGAIGLFAAGGTAVVRNATIEGSITGDVNVGGVIGESGSSATTHVIVDQSTVTATVVSRGDQVGGIVGFANGHVTISAVTRSGDVSASATGYAAGGFVGYNSARSLLIDNSTSSSEVRGHFQVGGAIGYMDDPATLRNVVVSGITYGRPVEEVDQNGPTGVFVTEVGCYVGTEDDASDVLLTRLGSTRATGMKVVDGVATPCPDYVTPGTGVGSLPPAVSELVTRPIAPPTTTPSTTVPTTRPPTTTTPPATTVPAPVPTDGVLPELEPGASQVIENGVPTNVEVFIDNTTDLVLRGQGFELRLAGDCTFGCTIQTDANGREVLTLEERGLANVSGEGFQAGTPVYVWLFSEPRFLGTLRVNPDGTFTGTVPLGDIAPGLHTLQVNGTSFDGLPRTANLGVIVNPAGAPTPEPGVLPATGNNTTPLWLIALTLLSIGLAITTTRRRHTR